MELVVAFGRQSPPVENLDRIVIARLAAASFNTGRAGDQRLAAAQKIGDVADRAGVAGKDEGERRFWPDEMRDVPDAGVVQPSIAIGKLEIAAEDGVLVFRGEGGALRNVGLDQAQLDPGYGRAGGGGQPQGAEARDQRQGERGADRRRDGRTRRRRTPQSRRSRKNRNRKEGQSMQADKRGGLGERQIGPERHSGVIPGKAGEG